MEWKKKCIKDFPLLYKEIQSSDRRGVYAYDTNGEEVDKAVGIKIMFDELYRRLYSKLKTLYVGKI